MAIQTKARRIRACFLVLVAASLLITGTASVGTAAFPTRSAQIKDPVLVAKRLYAAWRLRSRRSALRVADKSAVTKLFSVRWRVMRFEGCKNRSEGGYVCIYRDKKLDLSLAMMVDGGVSAGGYSVTSLSFSSED